MSMKNSKDIIGNRIRDLPARGALPQPTAPAGAPTSTNTIEIIQHFIVLSVYEHADKFVLITILMHNSFIL
jgi:hypothetical protein